MKYACKIFLRRQLFGTVAVFGSYLISVGDEFKLLFLFGIILVTAYITNTLAKIIVVLIRQFSRIFRQLLLLLLLLFFLLMWIDRSFTLSVLHTSGELLQRCLQFLTRLTI